MPVANHCTAATYRSVTWKDCRFGSYLVLQAKQRAYCAGVAHRVAPEIIIKVDENIQLLRLPFPYSIRPPAQIVIRIGSAVKMLAIWPMKPHINERRCSAQDARQPRPTHNAVSGPAPFQQLKYFLPVPTRMPEFDRNPDPLWHLG